MYEKELLSGLKMSKLGPSVNEILIDMQRAKKQGDTNRLNFGCKALYDLVREPLMNYAKCVLIVKADAEDCLFITLHKICELIHSFKPYKDGYNWLIKSMRNTAINMNRETGKSTPLDDVAYFLCNDKITEDSIVLKMDVRKALLKLSKKDREILIYYYFDQFSMDEISELFGYSKSTIHSHLKKSESLLRDILGNPEQNCRN
ncbi:MAG: sigma-70 family RNA polymerase sigma factor [Clostridia bacterium]|nr:sigma-70 family RNA polymerase sigma factor [Clostridia bacterium]